MAFARLLLSHLVDPMATVRAMLMAVRSGGTVAVEDLFAPSLPAEPPVPALHRLAEGYCATVRSHGGDPTIGPRLGRSWSRPGWWTSGSERWSTRWRPGTRKLFLAQLLDNMCEAIVEAGAAAPDELDELRAAVAAAAERPDTVFFQARMHQVSGRRP